MNNRYKNISLICTQKNKTLLKLKIIFLTMNHTKLYFSKHILTKHLYKYNYK